MAESAPTGWEGILDTDETILWQARPSSGLSLHGSNPLSIGMGIFFMAFSLYWISMANNIADHIDGIFPKIFPLFGVPFFLIGAYNAFGHIFWQAYLRSKTHYTLTNKRGFIATDHPFQGKLLKNYPIDAQSDVVLKIGPPDSIWFAGKGVGFARIDDGREVLRLMRQIQKDMS